MRLVDGRHRLAGIHHPGAGQCGQRISGHRPRGISDPERDCQANGRPGLRHAKGVTTFRSARIQAAAPSAGRDGRLQGRGGNDLNCPLGLPCPRMHSYGSIAWDSMKAGRSLPQRSRWGIRAGQFSENRIMSAVSVSKGLYRGYLSSVDWARGDSRGHVCFHPIWFRTGFVDGYACLASSTAKCCRLGQ